jgi:hypothetical protein
MHAILEHSSVISRCYGNGRLLHARVQAAIYGPPPLVAMVTVACCARSVYRLLLSLWRQWFVMLHVTSWFSLLTPYPTERIDVILHQKNPPNFHLINRACIPLSCSNITITIYCNINKSTLQAFHIKKSYSEVKNTQFVYTVKTAAGFGITSVSWLFHDKTSLFTWLTYGNHFLSTINHVRFMYAIMTICSGPPYVRLIKTF